MAQQPITNKILASSKLIFGALSLVAPYTAITLFRFPVHAAALPPMRLFGIRELVVGGLIWTADSPEAVRRALIASAICDGLDTLTFAYGFWMGELEFWPADVAVSAGIGLVGLALWGLRKNGVPVVTGTRGGAEGGLSEDAPLVNSKL